MPTLSGVAMRNTQLLDGTPKSARDARRLSRACPQLPSALRFDVHMHEGVVQARSDAARQNSQLPDGTSNRATDAGRRPCAFTQMPSALRLAQGCTAAFSSAKRHLEFFPALAPSYGARCA